MEDNSFLLYRNVDFTVQHCTVYITVDLHVFFKLFLGCNNDITCVAANTVTHSWQCQAGTPTKCSCLEGYYGDLCQYQRGNTKEYGLAVNHLIIYNIFIHTK